LSRKLRSHKFLKLLVLLVVSVLIATASAAVYYSMIAQPSVTIAAATISFVQGTDWPAGSALGSNSTWVSLALKAYPNVTLAYDQPLNISNTDSASHTFRLRHVSISPLNGNSQVSNFTSINFVVENVGGAQQATFNYTTTGTTWNTPASTSYLTLPGNMQWILYAQTVAAASAQNVAANIVIAVDVTQ